jgi:hypothetical protein
MWAVRVLYESTLAVVGDLEIPEVIVSRIRGFGV